MKKILLFFFTAFATVLQAQNNQTAFEQLVAINKQWQAFAEDKPGLKITEAIPLTETELIQFHLQQTEQVLRARNPEGLTQAQQQQRHQNLNTLHTYWQRGLFPVNDHHLGRQPYFIDKYNTHCAVGYLMQQTGADAMARAIHSSQNYSYLKDITHPQLADWIHNSGLTLDELALIQPSYTTDRPVAIIEMHYNNVGTDVNEYIEIQQAVGFYYLPFNKVEFYDASKVLYKTLPIHQMVSLNNMLYAHTFDTNEYFADTGTIKIWATNCLNDVLVDSVLYGANSVSMFGRDNNFSCGSSPRAARIYNIGENESTPVGTSLTLCGTSNGQYIGSTSFTSIPATMGTLNPCLALPISLTQFYHTISNKKVLLHWETVSEINTSYFSVEKTANGIYFEPIGKVAAAGNSSSLKKYSFTDANAAYINQYRLKQVDLDGKATYSKIIFVKLPQANLLAIAGTVASTQLSVQINAETSSIKSLAAFDVLGKKIQSYVATNGLQHLNIGQLAPGKYLLQLLTADGQKANQSFIKWN